MSILLKNANLFAPESLGPGSVRVEGTKIAAVYKIGEPTPDVEAVDLCGAALGPGLIDVHTHGADRVELMDGGDAGQPAVAQRMARFFARHGVTGFLPTTVTASFEAVGKAVESARCAMANPTGASGVLGVHFEGPFVSPQRLGAQSPEFCIPPTAENVARLLEVGGGLARIVTLAPEEEGGIEAVKAFTEEGIVVSLGHTVATSEQAAAAFTAGARQVTHLFNAMQPMHHRRPGVVGAALTTKGVMVEIIADGVHLAPTTVRLVVAAKGIEEVLLVTDSMAATGCEDGEYILGPMKVYVRDGEAWLESGNLAGSTLTLERAVTHVARWTDAGLSGAWQMASLNPARLLGIDDHVGKIVPGYDADLTAIDANGRVVLTMVGGEIVYQA